MKDPDPVPAAVRSRLERLVDTPELFLRDVDPVRRSAALATMTEDSYRASSFLDTRVQRAGDRELAIPLDTLLRLVSAQGSPHRDIDYIFHLGHCGSSLLSRLLGELPEFLALREPPLLMGLARSHRRLEEPGFPISQSAWDELLGLSLVMLGRTWRPAQRALIKPSSHVASLIPMLMRFTGNERALILHVDLETYLASMLRPGVRRETRLFARDFRLRDFTRISAGNAASLDNPSDPQLAAMNWLLQTREFAIALDDTELQGRLLPVNFDNFLSARQHTLAAVCRFLRAEQSSDTLSAVLAGPAATRHAKSLTTVYDAGQRGRELAAARASHADEIGAGLEWARQVAGTCQAFAGLIERFSRATELPAPL